MVKNGGDVLDAYGFVNVIAPCGIPMRGIVGIHPDPIMLVAINCENVQRSKEFYQQLGFVEQVRVMNMCTEVRCQYEYLKLNIVFFNTQKEYPYARLSKGTSPFEPEQPKGSAYMAPSPNCMGVLLLPIKKKKKVTPNPVFSSLNIVYTPPSDGNDADVESELIDLSGVVVKFQSATKFATLEKATR